jgi:gluconate 5-dehydrogenase
MAHLKNILDLSGQVAVVTGGATGIGLQMAKGLAEAGANIVICSRRLDVCEQAISEIEKIGVKGLAVGCDVTKADQVEALKDAVLQKFGRVDILVNNAGRAWVAPPEDTPLERWQQVFDLNITAPFLCAQAFGREFIKQKRGKIVNIASGTVFKGHVGITHYVTSKGGIVALTRCLARELGPYNINVNAIAPGLTMSEGVLANPDMVGAPAEATKSSRAFKRAQSPDDLTGTLIYLCSTDSDFVTGHTVVCDGGSVMR